jgi:hypothetical protein
MRMADQSSRDRSRTGRFLQNSLEPPRRPGDEMGFNATSQKVISFQLSVISYQFSMFISISPSSNTEKADN